MRVIWTLEEVGAPYELTVMTREEGRGEAHRHRHPLGRVPVLEDDEGFLFESAAVCLHLGDVHPEAGLVPPLGTVSAEINPGKRTQRKSTFPLRCSAASCLRPAAVSL